MIIDEIEHQLTVIWDFSNFYDNTFNILASD